MSQTHTRRSTARVVPHDDGLAVVFDPALLRALGIDEQTPLSVTVDGDALRITPVGRTPTREQIDAALREINREWGSVLKRLAE